jgi:hypothetical protein
MADDLAVQFFTAAKAQHEASAKWHLIVLAVLAYFHLALAGPFAGQSQELAVILHERDQKRAFEEQLQDALAHASEFTNLVQAEIANTSGALRGELVGAFATLDAIVPQLIALGPERAGGDEGARLFQPSAMSGIQQQQQQQQQAPPQPETLTPTLAVMEPALRARLVEVARSANGDLRQVAELTSYISDFIVAPAIQNANEAWATDLQTIESMAGELDERLRAAIGTAGSAAAQLNGLREAVSKLLKNALELKFAAPSDTAWWSTIAGKDVSIQRMLEAMTESINQRRNALKAVESQAAEAARAIEESDQRAEDVTAELAKLEQQAMELQTQLGTIGEPLKVISIRLSVLAPLLPLVIALTIAALSLWRAEGIRRMRFAAAQAPSGADGDLLRRWLQNVAGGSARVLAAREIAIAGIALAWVSAAQRAVHALPAPQLSAFEIIGLALAALIGARAYHWYQSGQALGFATRR